MAALPGGAHPAAEPMQVDQPHPAAAAGAAPAEAKVRAALFVSAVRKVAPERSRRPPGPSAPPRFVSPPAAWMFSGGLRVRSTPRAARLESSAAPARAISPANFFFWNLGGGGGGALLCLAGRRCGAWRLELDFACALCKPVVP
jgi:hypothetical protein